jgi:hypothetical protein
VKHEVQHGLDSSDLGDLECRLSLFRHVRASYASLMLALAERDLIEHAGVVGDRRDGAREPTFNCERLSRILGGLQANGLGIVAFWNKTTSHRGSPVCWTS